MTIPETHLIWRAAGSPVPCDTRGEPIPPASGERSHCARCGGEGGVYDVGQLVSSNFIPTRNANRIHAFGGTRYCEACVFCAKTLRLRCISWFASEEGVRFWSIRDPDADPLATLLDPPEPPFVVGIPLYGINHGGESVQEAHGVPNWKRTWWPGEELHNTPLVRLQSKHVALYSRNAYSRDRYPVQVDDHLDFLLDRDVWLRARDAATRLMEVLIEGGVPAWRARHALLDLALPSRAGLAAARLWSELTAPLRPHMETTWWQIFCLLIPTLPTGEA